MSDKAPLADWTKVTLWFQVYESQNMTGPRVELDVWLPPAISNKDEVALLAKYASQGVKLIRQLTGTHDMLVQGQYKVREKVT